MIELLKIIFQTSLSTLKTKKELAFENLALRQQINILRRSAKRPKLKNSERAFWVFLSKIFKDWKEVLVIVKPETVIRWHRKGFKAYWRWKSRTNKRGRPKVSKEIRELIHRMSIANPTWGAPRIHGELLKLGIEISPSTVAKYMVKNRKPPSSTWMTFLRNHIKDFISVDFFTVPTATFHVLYVFLVMSHYRRRVLHFNVTYSPSAEWTGQQVIWAFPYDSAPRYLLRDRDKKYGYEYVGRVFGMGIDEILIAARSPWQNPYVERLIGSIRRECLDHCIVFSERHLKRILKSYFDYYHRSRTHLGLGKDAPEPRPVQGPEMGKVVEIPQVGGLHHRYERRAA